MVKNNEPVVSKISRIRPGMSRWDAFKSWLFKTDKWIFDEDWYYTLPNSFGNITILIPKGFVTDFASIPKPFWPLLSPSGILYKPGIVHDFGYQNGYLLDINRKIIFTEDREWFDNLFKIIGIVETNLPVLTNIAWSQIRMWGWRPWNKYRK